MCGITALISRDSDTLILREDYVKTRQDILQHRGPDNTNVVRVSNNAWFIFNRLKINDLNNDEANQPFNIDGNYLICNGEIFNWKELMVEFSLDMKTTCDCEVILLLYNKLLELYKHTSKEDICQMLCNKLDGEFVFVIYDSKSNEFIAARDPYGVRPLFVGYSEDNDENNACLMFTSELKGIDENICPRVSQFSPGHFIIVDMDDYVKKSLPVDYRFSQPKIKLELNIDNEETILGNINRIFRNAVNKRIMSDKEMCALLSGGLDSSLVCALIASHFPPNTLKTFSIGIKGSPDLEFAKIAANKIQTIHTSIELTEEEFIDAIDDVIRTIESYDTTTVRASVGNYLVAKYIKEHTNCKVVFNGDYSDEVSGGYKYMSKCDDPVEFARESRRLVHDIHYFDSLRSDRCISAHGLEARVPFADKEFVEYYLSIPSDMRMSNSRMEKYLLRKAFEKDDILPTEILWRKKEAFSDGVSVETRSWCDIINEHVNNKITDEDYTYYCKMYSTVNPPDLKETVFYRKYFNKYYKNNQIIPYYWLPKY